MAAPRDVSVDRLVKTIEESQYGFHSTLEGPFGTKRGRSTLLCIACLHVGLHDPLLFVYSHSGIHRLHSIWKVS